MHQHLLVALEVAEKFADVSLQSVDAPDFAQVLALGPTIETRELAAAPDPATVPQAPLGAIQTTNRLIGKIGIADAEAACGLQGMLEAHSGMPPVQHDRGAR